MLLHGRHLKLERTATAPRVTGCETLGGQVSHQPPRTATPTAPSDGAPPAGGGRPRADDGGPRPSGAQATRAGAGGSAWPLLPREHRSPGIQTHAGRPCASRPWGRLPGHREQPVPSAELKHTLPHHGNRSQSRRLKSFHFFHTRTINSLLCFLKLSHFLFTAYCF